MREFSQTFKNKLIFVIEKVISEQKKGEKLLIVI